MTKRRSETLLEPGLYNRLVPPKNVRQSRVAQLKRKPPEKRKPNDWWILGSYSLFDALLDEDDALYSEAIEFLKAGAEADPPSFACMLDLAWTFNQKGIPAFGIDFARRAYERFPDSRDVASMYALTLLGLGKAAEATDVLANAKHLSEFNSSDAALLASMEKGEDAKTLYTSTVFRNIDEDYLIDARRGTEEKLKIQRHILKTLIQNSDSTDLEALHVLSLVEYQLCNLDEARRIARMINAEQPTADTHCLLGLIAKRQHDQEEEIRQYGLALQCDENHPLSLINLACRNCENGEFAVASRLLETAMALPDETEHHYLAYDLYANCVAQLEEDPEKELSFRLESFKRDQRLGNGLNLALCQIANGRLKDARRTLTAIRNIRDTNDSTSSVSIEEYRGAVEHFLRASQSDRRDPDYWLSVAQTFGEMFGFHTVRPLLHKAEQYADKAEGEMREQVLTGLGFMWDRADEDEKSLHAWKLASIEFPESPAALNYSAKLGMMGKTTEALRALDQLPRSSERYWTIKGNTLLGCGLYLQAVEAYRIAIREDERFLLPYSNAIDAAHKAGKPELIEFFLTQLSENGWDCAQSELIKADALSRLGRHRDAMEIIRLTLQVSGSHFPDWKILHTLISEHDDSISSPDKHRTRRIAQIAVLAHDWDFLALFLKSLETWPGLWDGDFTVLKAEVRYGTGDTDSGKATLLEMGEQIPPMVSRAIHEHDNGDLDESYRLAKDVCTRGDGAAAFNHFAGNPLSIAESICSGWLLSQGRTEEAQTLAEKAYRRDRSSEWSVIAKANFCAAIGQQSRAVAILEIGLRRICGSPRLMAAGVRMYLDTGDYDAAASLLERNRELLVSAKNDALVHELDALIATSKLDTLLGADAETPLPEELDWLEACEAEWASSALHLEAINLEQHYNAAAFYLCKVLERSLHRIFAEPFRDSLKDASFERSREDLANFVSTGRPLGLGGLARALRMSSKVDQQPDEPVYVRFREFLIDRFGEDFLVSVLKKRAGKLAHLAGLRNKVAHQGELSLDEYNSLRDFIFPDDKGESALGTLTLAAAQHNT